MIEKAVKLNIEDFNPKQTNITSICKDNKKESIYKSN